MTLSAASAAQIASACGISKRAVTQRAAQEGWQFTEEPGRGGARRLYTVDQLPAAVRARLVWEAPPAGTTDTGEAQHAGRAFAAGLKLQAAVEARAAQARRERSLVEAAGLPPAARARMDARLAVLRLYDLFAGAEGAALRSEEARLLFARRYNGRDLEVPAEVLAALPVLSAASLKRWRHQLQTEGIAALAGAYGNRQGSGALDARPEVRDYAVAVLVRHPHTSARNLMRALQARFGAAGGLPGERALERWVVRWRQDNAEVLLALENPDAWKNRNMAAFGSASEPFQRINQLWELDSSPADVMCTDGRHALIGGIDVATRRARLLVVRTSKAVGVAALLRRMLLDFGAPEAVKTDNGSDYTSEHVKRVLDGLEARHELCPPFQPWHKPHVERFFRTFSHGLLELLPGYIGHSVAERQAIEARQSFADRLMQRNEVVQVSLSGAQLQDFCDQWLERIYHAEPHEALGVAPLEAAVRQRHLVRAIEDARALDMLLAEAPGAGGWRTVQKKGIKLDRGWFIAPDLGAWVGRQVQVRFDPFSHDLGTLYVFGGDPLRFVCQAVNPDRTGVDRREIAVAAKRLQRERVQAERRALKAAARSLGVDQVVDEVLRERAAAAGKLAVLPLRAAQQAPAFSSALLAEAAAAAQQAAAPRRTTADIENLAEVQAARERIAAQQVAAGTPNELAARREGAVPPVFESVAERVQWLLRQQLVRELGTEERDTLAQFRQSQPASYRRMQTAAAEALGRQENGPGRVAGDPGPV